MKQKVCLHTLSPISDPGITYLLFGKENPHPQGKDYARSGGISPRDFSIAPCAEAHGDPRRAISGDSWDGTVAWARRHNNRRSPALRCSRCNGSRAPCRIRGTRFLRADLPSCEPRAPPRKFCKNCTDTTASLFFTSYSLLLLLIVPYPICYYYINSIRTAATPFSLYLYIFVLFFRGFWQYEKEGAHGAHLPFFLVIYYTVIFAILTTTL